MTKQINLILILFVLVLSNSCDLYITSTRTGEVTSESGQIMGRGEWTYTKSKEMDMYEYYQKWENTYTEYFENGTVKSTYSSEHKRATYGRPCNEILSHYVAYHENGTKSFEQKDICDCSKSIQTSYDLEGNLIEKKVIRTKTKEIKKDKKK